MGCLVQDTYGSIITERVLLADDMPFVYRKERLLIRIKSEFLHGPYELWKGVICDSDLVNRMVQQVSSDICSLVSFAIYAK